VTSALLLTGDDLVVEDVWHVAIDRRAVALAPSAVDRMRDSRSLLDDLRGEHTYGVNTGFGRFVSESIPDDQAEELQLRLLRSHACGVGVPYPDEVVRAAMVLRANAIAKGYSGARVETVELLLAVLNAGIVPYVPARGSVGASGDLAPLAHLALPLVGEGEAFLDGVRMPGAAALAAAGLEPVRLQAKEGLSLINGTQFMSAMAALGLSRALRLARTADVACAMSLEALQGSLTSFHPAIHAARPHAGQVASAANVRLLLEGSAILESHRWCDKVQDAYSLRCAAQVHGASRDLLDYVERTVSIEINAATDNPLVLLEEREIVSNGNFHGQPVAFALDCLTIAVAELASISERRVERMVNPSLSEGLPAFLTREGGINSGMMILQYVSASLVSENKVLAHPASVDSIPTSAGQEDHVSMGNAAGLKALQVLANAEQSLAIELIAGAQAVEFLAPLQPGRGVAAARAHVRTLSERLLEDRSLSADIERVAGAVRDGDLLAAVEAGCGEIL
jgi:histidine ammonia-lyase